MPISSLHTSFREKNIQKAWEGLAIRQGRAASSGEQVSWVAGEPGKRVTKPAANRRADKPSSGRRYLSNTAGCNRVYSLYTVQVMPARLAGYSVVCSCDTGRADTCTCAEREPVKRKCLVSVSNRARLELRQNVTASISCLSAINPRNSSREIKHASKGRDSISFERLRICREWHLRKKAFLVRNFQASESHFFAEQLSNSLLFSLAHAEAARKGEKSLAFAFGHYFLTSCLGSASRGIRERFLSDN